MELCFQIFVGTLMFISDLSCLFQNVLMEHMVTCVIKNVTVIILMKSVTRVLVTVINQGLVLQGGQELFVNVVSHFITYT